MTFLNLFEISPTSGWYPVGQGLINSACLQWPYSKNRLRRKALVQGEFAKFSSKCLSKCLGERLAQGAPRGNPDEIPEKWDAQNIILN